MSLVEWKIHKENEYWKTKDKWFYPDKITQLYKYFKIPVYQLAQRYISNPESLPNHQIERLIHEADHDIRKLLENSLPSKNPTLLKISQKFSFKTANGLKILK